MFRKPISNIYDKDEDISDPKIRKIIFGYDDLVRKGILKDYDAKQNLALYKGQFHKYALQAGCSEQEAEELLKIKHCSEIHDKQNTMEKLAKYAEKHRFFGHRSRANSLLSACQNTNTIKEMDDIIEHQRDLFNNEAQGETDKSQPKHQRKVKHPKHDEFYEIINNRSNRLR